MKSLRNLLILPAFLSLIAYPRPAASVALSGLKQGLPFPAVTACSQDQGWLWVGTEKGLAVRRPGTANFTALPVLPERITALAARGGYAWVGTRGGLYRVSADGGQAEDYRQRGGVASGAVHVLVSDLQGRIWLGADGGLSLLPAEQTSWTSIPLPADTSGPVRAVQPSGSLCYVGAAAPDLLILDQDSRRWLRRTPPQSEVAITAIAPFGSLLYVGTDGQGLWRYDWAANTWERLYPRQGTASSFVLAAAASGALAWFGTFDSLLEVDLANGSVTPLGSKLDLPDGAVECLHQPGDRLLIGTESGLAEWPLPRPNISCEPQRSIVLSPRGEVEFTGFAQSKAGIKNVVADFAVQALPDSWFTSNITVTGPDADGRLLGRWKVDDLPSPSDVYLLRLRVTNQKGTVNTALAQIIVAPGEPKMQLNPPSGTINEGLQTLTGAFDTPFASDIVVNPGEVKAHLDRQAGTFLATLRLVAGGNPVRAELTDWFGRKAYASANIQAGANVSPETAVMVETSASGEETLTLNEILLFDSGSVKIKPSGYPALEKVSDYLNRSEDLQATIEGHTDNIPIRTEHFPDNLALSKARALAVFDYLIKNKNIGASRLTIRGMGETRPIASNKTSEGRAKNRRVEIIVQKPNPVPPEQPKKP